MTDKVPTFKKVSFEPALQHIFPNEKNIRGTGVNFSTEVERSSLGNELRSPLYCYSTCFHRPLGIANCPAKRFVVWEKKHARALLVEEA